MASPAISCEHASAIQMRSPPLSSPLELDTATGDYRCRLAKSRLVSMSEAVTKPLPKSGAMLTLASGCGYVQLISFPPTRRFFSNYFGCVLWSSQIHKLSKSGLYIHPWMGNLIKRRKRYRQSECIALCSCLQDQIYKPRPWWPVVVKYPVAVVMRTNGISLLFSQISTWISLHQALLEGSFGKTSCVLNYRTFKQYC